MVTAVLIVMVLLMLVSTSSMAVGVTIQTGLALATQGTGLAAGAMALAMAVAVDGTEGLDSPEDVVWEEVLGDGGAAFEGLLFVGGLSLHRSPNLGTMFRQLRDPYGERVVENAELLLLPSIMSRNLPGAFLRKLEKRRSSTTKPYRLVELANVAELFVVPELFLERFDCAVEQEDEMGRRVVGYYEWSVMSLGIGYKGVEMLGWDEGELGGF
ncbi:hypothetical protein V8F06_011992 [Rhypophila decipiens]